MLTGLAPAGGPQHPGALQPELTMLAAPWAHPGATPDASASPVALAACSLPARVGGIPEQPEESGSEELGLDQLDEEACEPGALPAGSPLDDV